MYDTLIVFYEKQLLVAIWKIPNTPNNKLKILDWYARVYGFDRENLSGVWIDSVEFK